jgi:hypothetical protein
MARSKTARFMMETINAVFAHPVGGGRSDARDDLKQFLVGSAPPLDPRDQQSRHQDDYPNP